MQTQFFFVHIMKTAGTTFRAHAERNFSRDEIFPVRDGLGDFERKLQYVDVHQFVDLDPRDRDRMRFFSAHVPYAIAEMTVPRAETITVLRDPVERTLSYLRQSQEKHPEHRGMALEEIYEDEWFFVRFIENYQTKMLSMTAEEALQRPSTPAGVELPAGKQDRELLLKDEAFVEEIARQLADGSARSVQSFADRAPTELVRVDEARLATALDHLGRIDALGTTEHLDDLMAFLSQRYGWVPWQQSRLNQTIPTPKPPTSFQRRIAEDNAADMALHERATRIRSLA